jgi:hypothetical protein
MSNTTAGSAHSAALVKAAQARTLRRKAVFTVMTNLFQRLNKAPTLQGDVDARKYYATILARFGLHDIIADLHLFPK